ncbi:LysR family transcriptional regulator [Massilia sp. TN1-12]|uniref:LysR family transcriptional regulator n=1 Tax=Massilia paldalensis TaxID=3377675 RepID=UPI0038505596
MNPTLRQMRAFVALARTGNFTLAADYLHVTQSALSGLIKELEQTLGVRVVDRSTRRIALTGTGNELYPLFSQMIDDLDGALANIADQAQLRKGIVRVAVPQLMACTLLPQVIAAWRERHPDIRISLSDSPVEGVTARVLSGETDFGIGPERDAAPQLQARLLMEMPFEAVVPPSHPLAGRTRAAWADLAAWPLISLRGQFTERLLADMDAAPPGLALKPAHEVTYMTTALALVAAGLGITVGMPYAAPLVRLHGLTAVPLAGPVLTRRFFVYTREQRSLTPAAEAFIAFLFDFVADRAAATAPLPR